MRVTSAPANGHVRADGTPVQGHLHAEGKQEGAHPVRTEFWAPPCEGKETPPAWTERGTSRARDGWGHLLAEGKGHLLCGGQGHVLNRGHLLAERKGHLLCGGRGTPCGRSRGHLVWEGEGVLRGGQCVEV